MRLRTMSFIAGALVTAAVASAHGHYNELVQQAKINRTPSAEVLKFHAVLQARLDTALGSPQLTTATEAPGIAMFAVRLDVRRTG